MASDPPRATPQPPQHMEPVWSVSATIYRCEQCGRRGPRGFRVIPATEYTAAITVCSNTAACRNRWPKVGDRGV